MVDKKTKPAELELQLLRVLWRAESDELPLPVREIRSRLADTGRDLAHTTVITTLNTMVEKGFLKRTQHKNAFRFDARVSEKDVKGTAINDVLLHIFNGSPEDLMLALLANEDIGADDIAEIRKLINRKARELNQ